MAIKYKKKAEMTSAKAKDQVRKIVEEMLGQITQCNKGVTRALSQVPQQLKDDIRLRKYLPDDKQILLP